MAVGPPHVKNCRAKISVCDKEIGRFAGAKGPAATAIARHFDGRTRNPWLSLAFVGFSWLSRAPAVGFPWLSDACDLGFHWLLPRRTLAFLGFLDATPKAASVPSDPHPVPPAATVAAGRMLIGAHLFFFCSFCQALTFRGRGRSPWGSRGEAEDAAWETASAPETAGRPHRRAIMTAAGSMPLEKRPAVPGRSGWPKVLRAF